MQALKSVAITLMLAVAVSAAAVWEEKPYADWSAKDVDKVLTDSPWAGKATLTHEREGANLGPVPDWKLVISVRSALPVKQALLRRELAPGTAPSGEQERELAVPSPHYVVAISNIPRLYVMQLTKAAQAARLKPKGKPAIAATDASVILLDKDGKPATAPARGGQASLGGRIVTVAQRGGGGFGGFGGGGFAQDNSGITATLTVEFPKTTAITAEDGEVEMSTVIGNYAVKKTFKLKEMVFKGALAF